MRRHARKLISYTKTLPDFLIIGCEKCGTTSLYDYLIQHSKIISSQQKEVEFFASPQYSLGIHWYKSHFPTKFKKRKKLTGEAYPNTIFYPLAPQRVKKHLPRAKFIVLLRNPVKRAYSAWNMHFNRKFTDLTFEESLERENQEFKNIRQKFIENERYWNTEYIRHAYLAKSIYADQLKEWFKYFPREQFLIIITEDLKKTPTKVLSQVFNFLDISDHKVNLTEKNVGNYRKEMNHETETKLIEFFKPHNERLYKLLGKNLDWDK